MRVLHSQELRHDLTGANLHIAEQETPEREQAATAIVKNKPVSEPVLRSTKTGVTVSVRDAFLVALQQLPQFVADVVPNQPPKQVAFTANYRDDEDHYVIDTTAGPVRITSIDYEGTVSIVQTDVPLSGFTEYQRVGSDKPVSQTTSFTFPVRGETVAFDLHHLTESGHTHLSIRKVGPAPIDPPKDSAS